MPRVPETTRSTTRLVVPDTRHALGPARAHDDAPPSCDRTEIATRRILRAVGLILLLTALVAATVPIPQTVRLEGQLVPERIVTLRAAEPGLLTHLYVAPGDTLRPRQRVARLLSPDLDELMRTAPGHDPALLARRARLDVHAPPFAECQPDGTADPTTLWRGGIVLSDDLDDLRGARLGLGDPILELATVSPDGRVRYVIHAEAPERDALRIRPGLPARITVTAVPHTRPRQAVGTVRGVALAPDPLTGHWRVEVDLPTTATTAVEADRQDSPPPLRAGFSVDVSIEERRETMIETAIRWARARLSEPPGSLATIATLPGDLRLTGRP